jgi:hypothetical protein
MKKRQQRQWLFVWGLLWLVGCQAASSDAVALAGNADDARVQTLLAATAAGTTAAMKGLVDQCLSEYDLEGWKIPGMVNPEDVNLFASARTPQTAKPARAPSRSD